LSVLEWTILDALTACVNMTLSPNVMVNGPIVIDASLDQNSDHVRKASPLRAIPDRAPHAIEGGRDFPIDWAITPIRPVRRLI
jgi:hypothetical protein